MSEDPGTKLVEIFHVVQGNRYGNFTVLNTHGGYMRDDDGRWWWHTRAEAEQVKRRLTKSRPTNR